MKIFLLLFLLAASTQAMDRWTALAMLESGGDDHTVGRAGEISHYQIRQNLWPGGKSARLPRQFGQRPAHHERARGRV